MQDNQTPQPASPQPAQPPRRFVYRSTEPESEYSHPARRKTDTPRPFQAMPGQLCHNLSVLKMRVYLKLN